ncbi:hypothetical protein [Salinibacterium sp. PAMC 21357]|uniref:hypothetical protein n=1 Tax=Salinibacterium sp. PAMC 21357 TaxID=1112215 RepID=UPI000289DD72|nr:hypothetical protein [Salinibacterium sp. PAMC 21357]
MTVLDILKAALRRWYVLLLVLVLTGFLTATFFRDSGAFATRTAVTFTLPARTTLMANSGSDDSSVIAFAGAIAAEINLGKPALTYSTVDAPYYGAGVRQGILVSLRNEGNQWVASYPSATIEIQIVGRSREWVQTQQQELLTKIADVTDAQQRTVVPAVADRITATVEPTSTQIDEITPTRTTEYLAVAAMALAGVIVGTWSAVGVDQLVLRLSTSRRNRALRRVPTAMGRIAR